MTPRRSAAFAWALACLFACDAQAFTYIVQKGDTLAAIAERFYGRIQHEKILVSANALDAHGGTPIVPGMRLEVPAVAHRRVRKGETWAGLSVELLGAAHRADVLAIANGTSPWLPPAEGSEILVPYNLPVVTGGGDTIVTIAFKFLGDMNKAWVLDHYNGLKGRQLARGEVVLVPLTDLPLTAQGRSAAQSAAGSLSSQAAGDTRLGQRKVQAELPALFADVKNGRYVDAVTRGNRFLASVSLTKPQLAAVHRQLLEAYAALDATGLATKSCSEWRSNDPSAKLDPVLMSPKLVAACERSSELLLLMADLNDGARRDTATRERRSADRTIVWNATKYWTCSARVRAASSTLRAALPNDRGRSRRLEPRRAPATRA
jgi:phage tail protein X